VNWGSPDALPVYNAIQYHALTALTDGASRIKSSWLQRSRDGYIRLHEWINATAPQLKPVSEHKPPALRK